jgi:tetratricopeptide (TPR) repeat protein
VLEELLAERPSDPGALRAMGYLDYFAGDLESARRHFMALLGTGRHTNDALFYLGSIADAEGDIEEAARLYSRVNGGENLVSAQVRLALVMYRMGRPELAVDHLEEFAEMQPEAALELGVAQAELLTRMDETERALEVYERLVERYPESDQLLYSRALLFERLDRVDDAVADLRRIAGRNPQDAAALNALGYTLADRTESHQEAYDLIRRANELDPDNAAIIDSMGWVLYRLGQDEEALPWLERAWSLQRDPEVAAHLGEVLWSMGRQDAARDIWTEAIVEFPGSDVLLETMGRLDP